MAKPAERSQGTAGGRRFGWRWALWIAMVAAAVGTVVYLQATVRSYHALWDSEKEPLERLPLRGDLSEDERLLEKYLCEGGGDIDFRVDGPAEEAALYWLELRNRLPHAKGLRDDPDLAQEMLDLLEQVEAIEPDNALCNYLKAAILMEVSSDLSPDEGVPYEYLSREGEIKRGLGYGIVIHERAGFEQGVGEFLKGAGKLRCTAHVFEPAELELRLCKPPMTLPQYHAMVAVPWLQPVGHGGHLREMIRRLSGYVLVLISEGERQKAAEVLGRMRRPGVALGADAQDPLDIYVAHGLAVELAMAQAPALYERLDMPEAAARAADDLKLANEMWVAVWSRPGSVKRSYDPRYPAKLEALVCSGMPVSWGDEIAIPAVRKAEHIGLLQRSQLYALQRALLVVLLVLSALTVWLVYRHDPLEMGSKLFAAGWRRSAWVVLAAAGLPAGVYGIYMYLTPLGWMLYPYGSFGGRQLLEEQLLKALAYGLAICLGYHAIRAGLRDAGADVPRRRLFNPLRSIPALIAGGILLIGVVLYYARVEPWPDFPIFVPVDQPEHMHWIHVSKPEHIYWTERLGKFLSVLTVAAALVYSGWQFWRLRGAWAPGASSFRRNLIAGLVPIIALCIVVGGLAPHVLLGLAERHQIRKLCQPGHRLFLDDLEMSPTVKEYRDHFRQLRDAEWGAED